MSEDPGYEIFFVMQNRIDKTLPTLVKNFGDRFYYNESEAIEARNNLIKNFYDGGMEQSIAEKIIGIYRAVVTINERVM